jgi:hypothetical protein
MSWLVQLPRSWEMIAIVELAVMEENVRRRL